MPSHVNSEKAETVENDIVRDQSESSTKEYLHGVVPTTAVRGSIEWVLEGNKSGIEGESDENKEESCD